MKRLQIIDSTTITLFSNLLFKGVGRHPKTGEKKRAASKVHTVIHANEGVPSDIKFTSAATNDSFMLKPNTLSKGDIIVWTAHISTMRSSTTYGARRDIRHQNEEKSEIQRSERHDVSDSGWSDGSPNSER